MLILDAAELEKLTGETTPGMQCKRLKQMGVTHRVRIDGYPIVTDEALKAFMGVSSPSKAEKGVINFKAIGNG